MLSVSTPTPTPTPWPWPLLMILLRAWALVLAGVGELFQQSSFGRARLVGVSADAGRVPECVDVAGDPGDAAVLDTVVLAVGEVVAPGAGGGAFAGRQQEAGGAGAEGGVRGHHDEDLPAFDAGAHLRSRGWAWLAS
jgi:hypothetical protein